MIAEAARITGLPRRTLQLLAAAGRIPGASKPAGRWTFSIEELHAWIEAGKPSPRARQATRTHRVQSRPPANRTLTAYEAVLNGIRPKLCTKPHSGKRQKSAPESKPHKP